jgi:predicted helicase
MDLRNHQKQCIDNINLHFESENKALIKMFCGSGKSFVIYHCLLQYTNDLSVVVVPSINLITQFNKDYLLNKDKKEYNNTHFNKSFEILTVCSKNELNQNIKITTDKEHILEFLKKDIIKIVLITYQSLELLVNVIKESNHMVDLLCLTKHIIF